MVSLVLSLDDDASVNTTLELQIDVFRTRGRDLTGSTGMNASNGTDDRPNGQGVVHGGKPRERPQTTTSTRGRLVVRSPSIHDASGQQLFTSPCNLEKARRCLPTGYARIHH